MFSKDIYAALREVGLGDDDSQKLTTELMEEYNVEEDVVILVQAWAKDAKRLFNEGRSPLWVMLTFPRTRVIVTFATWEQAKP